MADRKAKCKGCLVCQRIPAGETLCRGCLAAEASPARRMELAATSNYERLRAAARAGSIRRGHPDLVAAERRLGALCRDRGTIRTDDAWYTPDGVGGLIRRVPASPWQRPDGPAPREEKRAHRSHAAAPDCDSILEFLGATEGMEVACT